MDKIQDSVREYLKRAQQKKYQLTSQNYDYFLEQKIQIAVSQKRSGNYLDSISTYIEILDEETFAQSAILFYMYKSIASAGYLTEAFSILILSNRIMKIKNKYDFTGQDEHIDRLKSALYSESALTQYLQSISGNPMYRLPRSFSTIKRESLEELIPLIDLIIK